MRPRLAVPDADTRARLVTELSADDPEPKRCRRHADAGRHAAKCEPCRLRKNWRCRMQRRFLHRGYSFAGSPFIISDPRPAACTEPDHVDCQKHRDDCTACRSLDNWRSRDYRRRKMAGDLTHITDVAPVVAHLKALEDAGLILTDVARLAGINNDSLYLIRSGRRKRIRVRTAELILAIPIPEKTRTLIRDVGGHFRRRVAGLTTFRRVRALAADGFSIGEQAAMLGYNPSTMYGWFQHDTVTVEAADAMFELYRRLGDKQEGTNLIAAGHARKKGWLGRRYFSEANIDDPAYDPLATVAEPLGLRRRLRAMAWLGHGPEEIGPEIGEPADRVRTWMLGGPAPAYVNDLVIPVYERLSFVQGPNQEAADRARHEGWASPVAWDDVDMDNPKAKPIIDRSKASGKTKHVLTSVIFDALDGQVAAKDLLKAEKVQVVWILHRRGWSDRRIAAWLRWAPDAPDLGQRAVTKFREREEIVGFGLDDGCSRADEGLILLGAAA